MVPGRKRLAEQPLAEDERLAVARWLAALDAMEEELTEAERALAAECLRNASCTCKARPFMPRRMSVAPVASQTRTPDGGIIIGAALPPRGARLAG